MDRARYGIKPPRRVASGPCRPRNDVPPRGREGAGTAAIHRKGGTEQVSDTILFVVIGIMGGVFVTGLGLHLVHGAPKRIGWI